MMALQKQRARATADAELDVKMLLLPNVIEQEIIPILLKGKTGEHQLRIWVAGCATGEEAYSLAILFCEK